MLIDDFRGELERSSLAEWLSILIETNQQTILAHDGLEEGIIGKNGWFQERPVEVGS